MHEFIGWLIHHQGVLHSDASHQGAHLTAKEIHQWAQAHWIDWFYNISHHSEMLSLAEWQNGFLNSIMVSTGIQHPQRIGSVLENAVYILNQRPLEDAVFLIARIYRSGNQKVEVGVTTRTIIPTSPPSHPSNSELWWFGDLTFHKVVASTGWHYHGSTDLEDEIPTWPFWALYLCYWTNRQQKVGGIYE